MPQTDWLTLNKNRRYPFVPATLFDVDTGHDFPGDAAFLDAGFTLGIDSNFVPGRDNVYLDEWRITATNVYFSFKVEYGATADYNPFLCYRWVFSFDITADAGATSFSIPERDLGIIGTENVQNPALGLAFLTIGDISQIVAAMPASVGFFIYVPQVEPALLQTQAGLFVKNLKLANEPRLCPPVCPCAESSSSSSSLSPGAIQQTVGIGGDHLTWGAADIYLAGQSPLTDDYEFVQISDTTETSTIAQTFDANGHTVLMRSDTPHNGDPTAGHICSSVTLNAKCIALNLTGAGLLEIKDLNIQYNTAGLTTYGIFANIAAVDGVTYIHDNIIFNASGTGYGIYTAAINGNLYHNNLFNNKIDGWSYGCYSRMNYDNGPIIENCTFLNAATAGLVLFTSVGVVGRGSVRNCVYDQLLNIGGASQVLIEGYNNASVDASALDANWAPGSSGNNINITLLNEFASVTTTDVDYGTVKASLGGVCFNGGVAPVIPANTYGIRLNIRPHGVGSEVSIGADEFNPSLQTVGTGGDHATWEAAQIFLAAASPIGIDYDFVQVSDVTETNTTPRAFDCNGHTVVMRSSYPPNGDPTTGWRVFSITNGATCINLNQSGLGHIEIKDLHIRFATGGATYGINLRMNSTGTTSIHDNLVFNLNPADGYGITASFDIPCLVRSHIFNNETNGWRYGCYPIMQFANGPLVENCTFLNTSAFGGGFRVYTAGLGYGIIRNCIFDKLIEAVAGSQLLTEGYNNASVNNDAQDANWAPGSSGNHTGIALGNELISTSLANSSYAKVRDDLGGVCFNGGVAPVIPANTYGIRLNVRPHGVGSEVSVGADELVGVAPPVPPVPPVPPGPSSSSSEVAECVDPLPPEPTSAAVPIATALPNGIFIDDVKLKEGYNCSLIVTGNIIQIAAGLDLGEGMQCEDLRMNSDGSLSADSCVVCSGWLYSLNSQGANVEHLQLLGGPGVVIDPQPASNQIIVKFDEEGICEVDI